MDWVRESWRKDWIGRLTETDEELGRKTTIRIDVVIENGVTAGGKGDLTTWRLSSSSAMLTSASLYGR